MKKGTAGPWWLQILTAASEQFGVARWLSSPHGIAMTTMSYTEKDNLKAHCRRTSCFLLCTWSLTTVEYMYSVLSLLAWQMDIKRAWRRWNNLKIPVKILWKKFCMHTCFESFIVVRNSLKSPSCSAFKQLYQYKWSVSIFWIISLTLAFLLPKHHNT